MLWSFDLSCLAAPGWLLDVFGSSTNSSLTILEALGGSRSLQNHDPSALSVSQNPHGAPRGSASHDPSVLFVSGRLRGHDLSCLSVFGGLPGNDEGDWPGFDGPNRWGSGAAESYLVTSRLGTSASYLTRLAPVGAANYDYF